MTKWRGKIRYVMCMTLLLLLVLVAGTYIGNRMTEHHMITYQKAMIGRLYEQSPKACEEFLYALFQDRDDADVALADEALLAFDCAEDSVEYLYRQGKLKQTGDWILLLQIVFVAGILLCVERFLRIQQKQLEKQVGIGVDSAVATSQKEIQIAKDTAQKFVENIAHQIKTPLACVSLSLDMLAENLKEEIQKEKVKEAFGYLKQIEMLMKRLLDIGRLESGKQMLQKEAISMDEILQSCIHSLDRKEERIHLEVVNETEAENEFYGDYDWLREAFLNLLKNALEHDVSNEVEVTLRQQKELIFVQIRDHGEGIHQEDIKHIFDRFYIPNHAKKGHTGIGLNLAKLVVEKHFGTIEAVNHQDGGVLINICFPMYGLKNKRM